MQTNLFAKPKELNDLGKYQRQKPSGLVGKQNKKMRIEAPIEGDLINAEGAIKEEDAQVIEVMRSYLVDFLNHSFSQLVEAVQNEFQKNHDVIEDEEKFKYFRLCAFMLKIARLKAYEEQKEKLKQARAEAQALGETKIKKVSVDLQIYSIGPALQISHFESTYALLNAEIQNKVTQKALNTKNFHAAMRFVTEFLYCVREMQRSDSEQNQKNAQILCQHVFHHDMIKICQTSFLFYKEGLQHVSYLVDCIEFTHLVLEMLELYSKGKVIRIKTNRIIRKKKKQTKISKTAGGILSSEDEEAGANPLEEMAQHPEVLIDGVNQASKERLGEEEEDEDDLELSGEDEEFSEEYQERVFNFISEISILVDYQVIQRYLQLLKGRAYTKHTFLLPAITSFFTRVIEQIKAPWIFY